MIRRLRSPARSPTGSWSRNCSRAERPRSTRLDVRGVQPPERGSDEARQGVHPARARRTGVACSDNGTPGTAPASQPDASTASTKSQALERVATRAAFIARRQAEGETDARFQAVATSGDAVRFGRPVLDVTVDKRGILLAPGASGSWSARLRATRLECGARHSDLPDASPAIDKPNRVMSVRRGTAGSVARVVRERSAGRGTGLHRRRRVRRPARRARRRRRPRTARARARRRRAGGRERRRAALLHRPVRPRRERPGSSRRDGRRQGLHRSARGRGRRDVPGGDRPPAVADASQADRERRCERRQLRVRQRHLGRHRGRHGSSHGHAKGGSAYVFVRSGTAWTQQAKLNVAAPPSSAAHAPSMATPP